MKNGKLFEMGQSCFTGAVFLLIHGALDHGLNRDGVQPAIGATIAGLLLLAADFVRRNAGK